MTSQERYPSYVLITAARNEGPYIENTISSVIAQNRLPLRWVIISDGSEDNTDEIVRSYARRFRWIHFIRKNPSTRSPSTASKANSLNMAVSAIDCPYDYLGNLDADVTFEGDYFERLLEIMEEEPALGIAGGHILDFERGSFRPQKISEGSVAGAVQLFRSECFQQIGPFCPVPFGGADAAMEIKARYFGWKVRTIKELKVKHHRPVRMGTRVVPFRFRQGRMDWSLGYDFSFEFLRCLSRITESPPLLGSVLRLAGYFLSALRKEPVFFPPDLVRFLRSEQRQRLKRLRPLEAEKEERPCVEYVVR